MPRGSMPYSLTPKLYGSFLCGLFDEWYWDWKSGHYTASGYLMIIFILQWDCLPGRVQPAEAVGHILWWKGMEHCIHVISIV